MANELEFEDAKPNDEIYKDKRIVAFTRTNPKPPQRDFDEYGSYDDILLEEKMEKERRKRLEEGK